MINPLVTIVTPAFNQGEYLARTIESVLAQDYPSIEYIILDDGSTDSTRDVMAHYKDRVRCERHDNMGQALTLNKGWGMASGELIGYLSSDDCLKPNAISILVSEMVRNAEADLVYCDYELIDSDGKILREITTEDFDRDRMRVDLVCQPGPGALFRRKIFEKHGGWSPNLRQVPDFEYWLRISKDGKFVRVPERLAQYRVHNKSASFQKMNLQRSLEIVDVMSDYWKGEISSSSRKSIATANIIAAKNNFQSGRSLLGFKYWLRALQVSHRFCISPFAWRALLAGCFRRVYYGLFNMGNRI